MFIVTYNRFVKNRLQILSRLWKNETNVRSLGGGGIFDSHCRSNYAYNYCMWIGVYKNLDFWSRPTWSGLGSNRKNHRLALYDHRAISDSGSSTRSNGYSIGSGVWTRKRCVCAAFSVWIGHLSLTGDMCSKNNNMTMCTAALSYSLNDL